MTAVKQSHL